MDKMSKERLKKAKVLIQSVCNHYNAKIDEDEEGKLSNKFYEDSGTLEVLCEILTDELGIK